MSASVAVGFALKFAVALYPGSDAGVFRTGLQLDRGWVALLDGVRYAARLRRGRRQCCLHRERKQRDPSTQHAAQSRCHTLAPCSSGNQSGIGRTGPPPRGGRPLNGGGSGTGRPG